MKSKLACSVVLALMATLMSGCESLAERIAGRLVAAHEIGRGLEVELKVDPKKCYIEKADSFQQSTEKFVEETLKPTYSPVWSEGAYIQSTSDGVTETVCRVTFRSNWSQSCYCRQAPAPEVKSPWRSGVQSSESQ